MMSARKEYYRSLWLELDKPAVNEPIWKEMRQRQGNNGCPVVSITIMSDAAAHLVFRYSDNQIGTVMRETFQKEMSEVRNP